MRNALVSAQQICEEIKNNARKEGDLTIEEAKGNARKIIEAAQTQAIQLQTEISQLDRQREEFKASLKSTVEMHLRLLSLILLALPERYLRPWWYEAKPAETRA